VTMTMNVNVPKVQPKGYRVMAQAKQHRHER
jgi:hypothetical protein